MRFEVGHIYTHNNMLDVCMLVVCVFEEEPCHLHVRWFKRNGLDFNATNIIRIKEENLGKWYELTSYKD